MMMTVEDEYLFYQLIFHKSSDNRFEQYEQMETDFRSVNSWSYDENNVSNRHLNSE